MKVPPALALLLTLAAPVSAQERSAVPFDQAMLESRLGVCVHLPGGSAQTQMGALEALGVKRIRTDVFYENPASPELLKFKGGGWDVLGIMLPEHGEQGRALFARFERDPEAFIDRFVQALPWIQHWEFSNETDNFADIPAEAYVGHLKKAYEVFARKYPEKTLVSAAPMGNDDGAKYLSKMIKAGLLTMPSLVVGMHVYDAKAEKFKQATGRRVWVTESGAQWNDQIKHWDGKIREISRVLRPERIYWYANWEAKPVGQGDGWLSFTPGGPVTPSPLYTRLLGVRAGMTPRTN